MCMADLTFPARASAHPIIYAYSDTRYPGCLKVGMTSRSVQERMKEHYPTVTPSVSYRVELVESAMYPDGGTFTDHDVHDALPRRGVLAVGGEWFRCTVNDVKAAIIAVRSHSDNVEDRTQTFSLRPEQEAAIQKTMTYFLSAKRDAPNRTPKFLWNAKMRFGKTFAAYQLARRMGMKRVLVLTFKPAVESAWREDLLTHVDFEGWQFVSRDGLSPEQADMSRPMVCFGSFQDYLGTNELGGIKARNEWVHVTNWDMVIFDEYHFGAWRENAKKLFEAEDEDAYDALDVEAYKKDEADNAWNETFLPITTSYYLFLSGTPFRALNSGEFIEEQIYNWTYTDEQRARTEWGTRPGNPYAALPRMVMLTYRMPDEIQRIAKQGEFDEFDLNVFFSAKGKGDEARFVYESYVQKWLDLIRGAYLPASTDDLKLGQNKRPAMPYSDARLLSVLTHTFWFLPNVAACFAMRNLLRQRQNSFYHDYQVLVCAGTGAGIGKEALVPVRQAMGNPLETKTITLSCGKLTTGVTVKPWTGVFMLRNLSSPETYFQAAFRVQSPWEIETGEGREIMKQECYVFDFALDRALRQIADYSCCLDVNESNPEKKVGEFIRFLPVIAYDGSAMRPISAEDILDITMAGTSATLLARRWESALLVNVDNTTLARLMANQAAMDALMSIEGFRSLNSDIETIINKSEAVKKAKKDGEKLTPKQKKELSDAEKEYKSKRKQIQEKLIKFATRVPVFMYLTDYREHSLRDVITQLEPELFKKVTGLDVKDFDLLVSLGLFNGPMMNDAIYKFKRYEDASLAYTGLNRHQGEAVGLWDTVVSNYDYFVTLQQASMAAPVSFRSARNDEHATSHPTTMKPERRETDVPKGMNEKAHDAPALQETRKVDLPAAPQEKWPVEKGSKVIHKLFGTGTVERFESNHLTVAFEKGNKMFLYPSVFENGFLSMASSEQ